MRKLQRGAGTACRRAEHEPHARTAGEAGRQAWRGALPSPPRAPGTALPHDAGHRGFEAGGKGENNTLRV